MTYMPADTPRNQQQQLDIKFHEYKLAALTGLMASQKAPSGFGATDAEGIAVICDKVARAMERMDLAESGDGP